MKHHHIVFILLVMLVTSGCTAIGFVADMALIKATEDENAPSERQALELTQLGAQADAAFIADLLKTDEKPVQQTQVQEEQKKQSEFVGSCSRTLKAGESCYSAEYYMQLREQLQITESEEKDY